MTDFAQKARLAVAWTTGLNVFRDTVQFGLMFVLVRLLPTEAYGQFGLVNTMIGFMMVFSSREFIAHTLIVRDDREVNYQEQFVAGCLIQGTLFVIANVLALALRWSPTYSPVAPLLHVGSLALLLDLPSELRFKMIERTLDWRRLRTLEAIAILGSALLSIALVFAGAGVYALLVPSFVMPSVFMVDLFLIARWRPTLAWEPARYRASRSFGVNRVLSTSFVSASNLLESGVLARVVGYAVLGVFGRALSLATLFCQRFATLLMSSLYAVLARIPRGSDAYQRVSALVLRTIVWVVMPVATVISLLGTHVVTTLYGSRWVAVIPLVPWAMIVGACLAVVQAAYSLLLAHQETRGCFYADLWRLVGMGLALAIALPFGLVTYLGALAVVHGVALVMVLSWLHRSGGLRLVGVSSAFLPAAAATILAALLAEASRRFAFAEWPAIPLVLTYGLIFASTYLVSLRLLFGPLLRELVGYLPEGERVHRLLGFAEAA